MGIYCWCDKCGQELVNEEALRKHEEADSCHWFKDGEWVNCVFPKIGGGTLQQRKLVRIERSKHRPPTAWVEVGGREAEYRLTELRPQYHVDILTKAAT
jgi:hypothetical protein